MISLPNRTGQSGTDGGVARGPNADEAKAAGADLVGAEIFAAKINAGEMNFRALRGHAGLMGVVGRSSVSAMPAA